MLWGHSKEEEGSNRTEGGGGEGERGERRAGYQLPPHMLFSSAIFPLTACGCAYGRWVHIDVQVVVVSCAFFVGCKGGKKLHRARITSYSAAGFRILISLCRKAAECALCASRPSEIEHIHAPCRSGVLNSLSPRIDRTRCELLRAMRASPITPHCQCVALCLSPRSHRWIAATQLPWTPPPSPRVPSAFAPPTAHHPTRVPQRT